jgi:hypothetical protein
MSQPTNEHQYAFDRPGIYCIRVFGFLDESWSEKLGGMSISARNTDGEDLITTVVGKLPDQAALSGVLETLYEAHLTLVSVERL